MVRRAGLTESGPLPAPAPPPSPGVGCGGAGRVGVAGTVAPGAAAAQGAGPHSGSEPHQAPRALPAARRELEAALGPTDGGRGGRAMTGQLGTVLRGRAARASRRGPPSRGPPAFRALPPHTGVPRRGPKGQGREALGARCAPRFPGRWGAHPPPQEDPTRAGVAVRRRRGRDSRPSLSGKLAEMGTGRPSAHLGKLRPETGGISFHPPARPSPVPKYSPAREWAARGAALALGPPGRQQSCREEPDSPRPERSSRDERAAPAAATARERGPPRGEGRGRGGATDRAPLPTRLGGRGAGSAR